MADTVRIEIAVEAVDNTGKALEGIVKNLQDLAKATNSTQSSIGKASEQVTKFDKQADKTQKTLRNWIQQKWQVAIEAKDKVSPVLSTIKGVLSSLAGKAWGVTLKAFDLVTTPVRGILNILKNPIFQAGSILGVSIGLKDTIDTYKGFEAAMSQVQAVSGATSSDLEKLTAKAKEMGATTKFTAEESAQAFNYMAMAGWKTSDMMNGIEGILNLAAASGEDLATTSDIVTDALTAFNMTAGDAGHFSDVLAAASSNANTNVSMMGETFKYVGAMAGTLGYSIEDTALAIGLMANAGIKSSQAGTELNSIFTRLSTNTNGARDAIEELGIKFYDSTGAARPFGEVLGELREKTKNFTDEQKTNFANTVAGQRAQAGLLAMLNATAADYNKLTEAVNNADGASTRMAETMLDNVEGSLTLLQSALDGVKISAGERLAPYVRGLADSLTGAMPAIQQGVEDFMDWFDGKVEQFKARYQDAISTPGFEDMDLFGKVNILWDKIIADPFSEWWNGKGKTLFSNVASDIGAGVGTDIKTGILMLLGIDVSDTTEQGVSIGKSFAEGFAAGFDTDAVGAAFKKAIGGLFSNVGKLFPGGEAPGLDTAISAFLLYKMASPALAVGKGAATIGKSIFAAPAGGGTSLAGSIIGTSAGTGLLGLGSNTAITLGAGNLAGGASLGTGALSALGLGSIAGGVIGAVSAGSGFYDWNRASRTEDQKEKEMLQSSGNWKVGGVAAGAAAGMAIGSVVPVIGTAVGGLIGAGIGGAVGMYQGGKRKKEYEEQVKAAQEAAEAEAAAHELITAKAAYTGQTIREVTFKSQELTEAFRNTEVSAESFGAMFREAVSEKVTSSFGNITLSLQEIKDLADSIVFDGMAGEAEKFENAVTTSGKALASVKNDTGSLEKMNWKASLGFNFSESDVFDYRSQVDNFVKDAQTYITDKHYEATVALRLITNGEGDTTGLDTAYESIRSELASKSAELQDAVQKALEDGVISTEPVTLPDGTIQLSEYEEITNLQNQISEIMNRVSAAEESAQLDALKIKYGGANLDAASFQRLQSELAANVESMTATYDEALQVSLTNLHLQLDQGAISEEDFQAQLDALTESYQLQISDMNVRVEDFQLNTIAEAFREDFEAIWPDIDGSVAEMSWRMHEAMKQGFAIEPDPVQWTPEQVSQWLGLDGLDAETQAAVSGLLQSVAETIPESIKTQLMERMGNTDLSDALSNVTMDTAGVTEALNSDVMDAVNNLDLSGATDALGDKVSDVFSDADLSAAAEAFSSEAAEAITGADYTAITEALDGNVTEAVSNADLSGAGDALQTALDAEFTDTLASTDLAGATEALTTVLDAGVVDAVIGADFSAGMSVLKTGLETDIGEAISSPEISGAKEALKAVLGSGIAEAIAAVDLSAAFAALTALRQRLEAQAQATLGAQMSVQVPVNLTYNYNVSNPTPPKPTVTAQTATMNVGARANGGFTTGAELSWVGEDGPEAIIPLGAKRRGRGLELYKQVGEILGVAQNANGGVYGVNQYGGPVYTGGNVESRTAYLDQSVHHAPTVTEGDRYGGAVNGGTTYGGGTVNEALYALSSAFDVRNSRSAVYNSGGNTAYSLSQQRGGDMYGAAPVLAFPSGPSVYNAGAQVSQTSSLAASSYDERNAQTWVSNAGDSNVYDNTRASGGNIYRMENAISLAAPVRERGPQSPVFQEAATAFDVRNSQSAVYNTNTTGGSFTDITQENGWGAFAMAPAFSLADLVTSYEAQRDAAGASESQEGNYTGDAGSNDAWGGRREYEVSDVPFSREGQSGQNAAASDRPPVVINVTMAAPQIIIRDSDAGSKDEILGLIRKYYKEAADDLCGVLAERLASVYENMPNGGD